jgi:5-oxoprolinase (ATP-hydrolysing) subunit A
MRIDLNADVGESYGAWVMGDDEALVPLVTSVNVACGAHAGDPLVMQRTVALAHRHGVAVGAHPGYPDRDGFGRRAIGITNDELRASLLAQLGALSALARVLGTSLGHVKLHGALYHRAARDEQVAGLVIRVLQDFDPQLVLVALAGSRLVQLARSSGLRVAAEAFADRAYESDGSLRSRGLPGAVLGSAEAAAEQAISIATLGRVAAHDGTMIEVHAQTLGVHGDTPGVAEYARAIRLALEEAGVAVRPLASG